MNHDYDVLVIGAGPSGLIAAISAAQGTPYWSTAPDRFARVLVLEEYHKPGGLAAFGTLTIANTLVLNGGQLKVKLLEQARNLSIDILTSTAAKRIRQIRGGLEVETTAGTFRANAVVIACGIFSHLGYLRFRNTFFLAETLPGQQAFVQQADAVSRSAANGQGRLLLVGSHGAVQETAARIRSSSQALDVQVLVDSRHDHSAGALGERLRGGRASRDVRHRRMTQQLSAPRWNAGDAGVHTDYLAIVFDYNTYKLRPENAVPFAADPALGLKSKDGYIVADQWGRTSVPGIWACGNAAFPVSGVLQALYTGFVAGLSARSATSLATYDDANGFLPWLATPNSSWAGWLGPACELFA